MTVTIMVPASEPEILEPEGDPDLADGLAQRLYAGVGRYDEFAGDATRLRTVVGFWGDAATAYGSAAREASTEHDRMGATLRRVARAVTAYADNLREHVETCQELVTRKAGLDRSRDALSRDIDVLAAATDVTPQQIAVMQGRAADLRKAYRRLVGDHSTLQRQVRSNEDQLRQAFESATSRSQATSDDGGVSDQARTAMDRPGAPGTGATPTQVHDWWAGLGPEEREAVIAAYPQLIGSTDGLPAGARDQANRVLLDDDLATLGSQETDGTLSSEERKRLANATATREALDNIEGYEDPISGTRPGGQLWLYDPGAFDGDGRVAVAVGDVDSATDVAMMVPGIKTEMHEVTGAAQHAMNLYESTRFGGDGSSVATMFWLGYNTPEGAVDVDTATRGRAIDGGERLADAVDGLRASRGDDPDSRAHLTVIGHSYGSTTTSYAATDHDLDVDRVALIGSPGAGPAEHARDFSVGEDNVYVGRNSRDAVAFLGDEGWRRTAGGLGVDPSSRDFDANRFEAESTERTWHRTFADHSRYYDHDTESLYNLGRIVDGQTSDVNGAEQSYDPFWRPAYDPESDREPTGHERGRSKTRE